MKKILAASLLVVVIVIVSVVSAAKEEPKNIELKDNEYLVKKGNLKFTVDGEGLLKPKEFSITKMNIRTYHESTISELVPEGTIVKAGDIICKFDTAEFDKRIEQSKLDVKTAESALAKSKEEYNKFVVDIEGVKRTTKFQYELDQQTLKKYEEIEAPKKFRQAEIDIQNAEVNLKDADRKLVAAGKLYEQDLVPLIELEKAKNDKKTAEFQLEIAKLNSRMYKEFDNTIDLLNLQGNVKIQKGKLDSQELYQKVKEAELTSAVKKSEAELNSKVNQLTEIEVERDSLTIRAKVDGSLQYGSPTEFWIDKTHQVGKKINFWQFYMYIPDMTDPYIEVEVEESDINKIKMGDSAFIKFVTAPSEVFDGKVIWVSQSGVRTWRGGDKVQFKIKCDVKDRRHWFKSHLKAEVTIIVKEMKDILYVPLEAVFTTDNIHKVYVIRNGKVVEQEVVIGDSDRTYVVVHGGLREHDKVLLYKPSKIDSQGDPIDKEEVLRKLKEQTDKLKTQ